MKKEDKLNKETIKSKYIFINIFSYIKDENFLYKLIIHSKSLQKHLDINLLDYQEKYIKGRINCDDYLYDDKRDYYAFREPLFDKLERKLQEYEINKKNIPKYVLKYFKNYLKDKENCLYEFSKDIDFASPFLDILSTSEIFGKIFNIIISFNHVNKKDNYIFQYKEMFKQLNKSKTNYSSIIFHYYDENDIDIIKDFNINFHQIKKMKLIRDRSSRMDNYSYFFKTLFSFNIHNSLIYFEFEGYYFAKGLEYFANIINNFKVLEYLILKDIKFKRDFKLKLNNLKYIKFDSCYNISFENNIFLKLKYLNLEVDCNEKILLKCPELIIMEQKQFPSNDDYDLIIDFSSIKNLKIFDANVKYLFLLENTSSLEKICLRDRIGENVIKKIISMNALKEIYFRYDNIKCLLKAYGKNYSVKKMTIGLDQDFPEDLTLDIFLKNFPNLSDLTLDTEERMIFNESKKGIKKILLTEDINSKINKLKFILYCNDVTIKFNCQPFEKIESIDINYYIINLDYFPFFCKKSNKVFHSLKIFRLKISPYTCRITRKFLLQLYNNIDNMPNLIDFNLSCDANIPIIGSSSVNHDDTDKYNNIEQNLVLRFIGKVLTLKSIRNIHIVFAFGEYFSTNKLKKLFPKIDFKNYYKVEIYFN